MCHDCSACCVRYACQAVLMRIAVSDVVEEMAPFEKIVRFRLCEDDIGANVIVWP